MAKTPIESASLLVAGTAAGAAPPLRPPYWAEACRHLMKRDRVMKKLIPQFPDVTLQSRDDVVTPARPPALKGAAADRTGIVEPE